MRNVLDNINTHSPLCIPPSYTEFIAELEFYKLGNKAVKSVIKKIGEVSSLSVTIVSSFLSYDSFSRLLCHEVCDWIPEFSH